MNKSVEQALFDITGRNNFDQINIEELQQIIDQHPYFPIAHLLLAKKIKQSDAELLPSTLHRDCFILQ